MPRRNKHSFSKRQKEARRKEEAAVKMARRQGKEEKCGDDRGDGEQPSNRLDPGGVA